MVLTMIENFKCPVIKPFVITQTYQEHLDYAKAHPEIKYNGGIDLYSDSSDIHAAFDGVIDRISFQAEGYGNYIIIKHSFGYTLYGHLEQVCCTLGEKIPAGNFIGIMGSTGFSTGTHLHFEMRDLTNKVIDPTEFFEEKSINACSPLTAISAEMGGNLRKSPMGDLITTIPCGTKGKILSGPVYRFGLACYQVGFPVIGWMAETDQYGTKILTECEDSENGND